MKIKDLAPLLYNQEINIYTEIEIGDNDFSFADIYRGNADKIPSKLLDLEIVTIGTYKRNFLDIRV